MEVFTWVVYEVKSVTTTGTKFPMLRSVREFYYATEDEARSNMDVMYNKELSKIDCNYTSDYDTIRNITYTKGEGDERQYHDITFMMRQVHIDKYTTVDEEDN